ncbi:uncharacterized protein GGS25DRAFT_493730 [Hypoxylon fragiforme]|uniref:uncharacterized protein n=1 Tax=Hypoxylon fragiforme TaxID=63214 RepID=UPI0020C6C5B9|nr:uncharacterized protein GGS25DRAFT_493730 [Hypoxylon fragiforme]KAI2606900.1 hypothetical protein GGS25DRAFT_493730 [Hypoxylon fragiforme]
MANQTIRTGWPFMVRRLLFIAPRDFVHTYCTVFALYRTLQETQETVQLRGSKENLGFGMLGNGQAGRRRRSLKRSSSSIILLVFTLPLPPGLFFFRIGSFPINGSRCFQRQHHDIVCLLNNTSVALYTANFHPRSAGLKITAMISTWDGTLMHDAFRHVQKPPNVDKLTSPLATRRRCVLVDRGSTNPCEPSTDVVLELPSYPGR